MKRIVSFRFLCSSLVMTASLTINAASWSWLYRIKPDTKPDQCNSITITRTNTPLFNQLLLSWNAKRPTKGFIRFFIQARNAATKKWLTQHQMLDWGADVQCSYLSEHPGSSCYHVRLEVNQAHKADAFRVIVKGIDGADINLQELHVTLADFSRFEEEREQQIKHLPSVRVSGVPKLSQMILPHDRAHHMCSPTSLSMLIGFVQQTTVDPLLVAARAYDSGLDSFGSWPFNAAAAFELSEIPTCVTRLRSFADIHAQLTKNIPVMVSVRGTIPGSAKEYAHGHLLLVTGWDSKHKKVLCHDPAFPENEQVPVAYHARDFLTAWEKSKRLAYLHHQV